MRTMNTVAYVLLVLLPAAPGLAAKVPRQASAAPVANPCAALPPATDPSFLPRLTDYMNNFCYRKEDWQHDAQVRTSNGVHPYVKVYYSPSMWTWMTTDHRMGDVPDGAILVKEQYPAPDMALTDWSIMVKDHTGAWDGWYWADISAPSNPSPPPSPSEGGCPEAVYSYTGFGLYCLNCHASAADSQGTFATTRHVMPAGPQTGPPIFDNIHQPFRNPAGGEHSAGPQESPLPGVAWSAIFANVRPLPGSSQSKPPCMVPESLDHVVAGKKPQGPQGFLTSDQCAGCHNATGTLSTNPQRPDLPSMLYPDAIAPTANLSIYGEWRYSMMGLAGRDPIFFAQLDTESTVHANLKDHPTDAPVYVQDLCLHCHGVMGQRQYHLDTGKLFARSELQDPNSKYGALGRDGVSCTVCHHIAAEGLGDPETFTGNFKLGPPGEVYGPYQDVTTLPMKNALGVHPMATDAQQIKSSKLCGSCHTIVLPVYNRQGERAKKDGKPAVFYEQATYLEWLNSSFLDVSCADCHMPTEYDGKKLAYKIANIEDNTFPPVDFRAPDKDITLQVRDPYPRHTLLGMNVFALEMFGQFRTQLGLYAHDPLLPGKDVDKIASGQETAVKSSLETEATSTAEVSISARKDKGILHADVLVKNLTGHSFPSGVGFRRAFLNFQVLDRAGNVLWASGTTSPQGVIVNGSGIPLKTEFFGPDQQEFQAHYWAGNPITREDQVQIYEELVRDSCGLLTTSFLSLDEKAKDNRLQPKGWSPTGPFADETAPVGTGGDPGYQNGSGSNTVRYDVSLGAKAEEAAYVRATLYYQTIPPYYLRQRSEDAHGPDTKRLVDFVRRLKVEGTPIESWRLPIATVTQLLN